MSLEMKFLQFDIKYSVLNADDLTVFEERKAVVDEEAAIALATITIEYLHENDRIRGHKG